MAGAAGRSRDESRSNSLSGPSADAWVGANELERDEVAAYLALAQVPGIGAARLRTLVAAFETAAAALRAPHGALAALPGFSRAAATAIRAGSPQAGHEILDQLDRLGAAGRAASRRRVSQTQSPDLRTRRGDRGDRSRARIGRPDHRRLCARPGTRGPRRPRADHEPHLTRLQQTHPAGREAGTRARRHSRGARPAGGGS